MKNKTNIMLNMLFAILSIVFLIIGVSEGLWLLMVIGAILFIIILILRGRQIQKMNRELKEMKEAPFHEIDDPENE
jgi:FtsH-binding integral membrane protein